MKENTIQDRVYTVTEDKVIDLLMHTATREEVNTSRVELKAHIDQYYTEIKDVRTEIKDVRSEIKDVRTEIKDVRSEIKDVRTELKIDINNLRTELKMEIEGVRNDLSALSVRSTHYFMSILLMFIGAVLTPIVIRLFF